MKPAGVVQGSRCSPDPCPPLPVAFLTSHWHPVDPHVAFPRPLSVKDSVSLCWLLSQIWWRVPRKAMVMKRRTQTMTRTIQVGKVRHRRCFCHAPNSIGMSESFRCSSLHYACCVFASLVSYASLESCSLFYLLCPIGYFRLTGFFSLLRRVLLDLLCR
jgi:hypothetical protein